MFHALIWATLMIGGWLIYNHFPKYFEEKAKSLATKEDIAKITAKIQEVKAHYAVSTSQRTAFTQKQRDALITFFESCLSLIGDKFQRRFGGMPADDGRALYEYETAVSELFIAMWKDYHRIILYFSPESRLPQAAEQVVRHSLEVRQTFKKYFSPVKLALLNEFDARQHDRSQLQKAADESNRTARAYQEAMVPAVEKMHAAFGGYVLALNTYLRDLGAGRVIDPLEAAV